MSVPGRQGRQKSLSGRARRVGFLFCPRSGSRREAAVVLVRREHVHVRYWHLADMPARRSDVRFWG